MATAGPEGPRRKVIVCDELDAAILEEHIYDGSQALIASALLSEHERDRESGALIPRQIEIQWPGSGFSMKLLLREVHVNQLAGDPSQLWTKPEYRGWANVDLADPQVHLPRPANLQAAILPEDSAEAAPQRRGLLNRLW